MRAYKANMIPGGVTPTINVSQYDNDYAVTVTLIEGAEIYTPPVGATIRVEGTKPDGHGFEYACTYQGNVVTMPIYTQMTVLSGRFPIELVVYQSGLRVGSCNIIFAVEKAPLGEDTDISETVIPDIIDAAQSSAEAAQEAAEQAQEAAAQVLSSQIVTEASGSIASISDGADDVAVKSLVATITPVQNLNGQANPYPAGGGVNILPPPVDGTYTGNGITAVVSGGKITLSGTTTESGNAIIIPLSQPVTVPVGSYIHLLNTAANASIPAAFELSSDTAGTSVGMACSPVNRIMQVAKTEVVTWDRIRFYLASGVTTNLSLSPMLCMTNTAIRTYAPYENICPISGRTGLTVTAAGKNLLAQTDVARTINGVTFTPLADGGYHISGTATANIYYIIYGGFEADAVPPPSYMVNGVQYIGSIDSNKCNLPIYLYGQGSYGKDTPFTVNRDVITACGIFIYVGGGTTIDEDVHPQIEIGSTATAYEPPTSTTYPITWETEAGTIYGGTLNVTTGVLTVDRAVVDMGSLTWAAVGGSQAFFATISDKAIGNFNLISSMYATTTATTVATMADFQIKGHATTGTIYVTDSRYSTFADFKAAVTGQTVCYELATPQTYQLTPTEVRTLLGNNAVYTDAGDVSVEYIADTKLYIDNKIAELQALVLEN